MGVPRWAVQDGFEVRFDWGLGGIERIASDATAIVIVDVLRFTTAVESAVAAGLRVHPHRWRDESAADFARAMDAVLAGTTAGHGPSLSPASLLELGAGARVVLPSPNGAACSLRAAETGARVFAGCVRNAAAVAARLQAMPGPIAVIACGELWRDGSLQPALEDLLGAGAILSRLQRSMSPEAEWASASHRHFSARLRETLLECASGRALCERGLASDVEWAAAADVSATVPELRDGCFLSPTAS